MATQSTNTLDLVIRNDLADIALLTDAIGRIGVEHRFAPKSLNELNVILDEAVSNVIKYAWPNGGDHEIRVGIYVQDCDVRIRIVDDGVAFDPIQALPRKPSDPSEEIQRGGVGIHMMKQLVDAIKFTRVDGRNHLTMLKRCAVKP